ncbi:MAG: PRC-barrel domain-containing protein [Alphaproteobacteria bacterium]
MISKNSLLAATCLFTMAGIAMAGIAMSGMASAASVRSEGATAAPLQIAAKRASETPDMMRASKFIGETVRNGKGEKIGSVDDLILNRGDRILYAVISVGGFLGVGDRLVAVPFEALEFGAKDVEGVVIYDTTKEQLKAEPAFTYAEAKDGISRERFMQSAARRVDLWQDRVGKGMDSAKSNAKEMKEGASQRVDRAWKKVQAEWQELKGASADAWQSAKQKFDNAMTDLEQAWDEAKT